MQRGVSRARNVHCNDDRQTPASADADLQFSCAPIFALIVVMHCTRSRVIVFG
jgi:hypothetical protein